MAGTTKFALQVSSSNAAMVGDEGYAPPAWAVADLLDSVAAQLRDGRTSGRLRDDNGQQVGSWSLDLD